MTTRILNTDDKNVKESNLINKKDKNEFRNNETDNYLAVIWQRRARMQCLSI